MRRRSKTTRIEEEQEDHLQTQREEVEDQVHSNEGQEVELAQDRSGA